MKAAMVWKCRECGETFVYYAPAQRHADETHPGRIEIVQEYRP